MFLFRLRPTGALILAALLLTPIRSERYPRGSAYQDPPHNSAREGTEDRSGDANNGRGEPASEGEVAIVTTPDTHVNSKVGHYLCIFL